jgi:hypothetical protein
VRTGHASDEFGGLVTGHASRCNEQRAGRLTTPYRDRMSGCAERALRHAEDRNADGVVEVSAKAWSATPIEVHIAIDENDVDRVGCGEDCGDGRQFAHGEVAGLVDGDIIEPAHALLNNELESAIVRDHKCGPGAARGGIVNIHHTQSLRHGSTLPRAMRRGCESLGAPFVDDLAVVLESFEVAWPSRPDQLRASSD